MNGTDFIIIAILLCIIGGVVFYLYRAKKRGKACIGCPYSGQCRGGCGSTKDGTKGDAGGSTEDAALDKKE